jgi:hypothetical protein
VTDGIERTPQLIRVFFDSAALAVQGIANERGFRREAILEVFTPTGMKRVTPEEAGGSIFWANNAFETSRLAGSITYGDRESLINMVVGPKSALIDKQRYGLWEWANAFGVSDDRASGGSLVVTAERVVSVVSGLGAVFTGIWPRIADAGPSVVARLEAARTRVREASASAQAQRNYEHVVARAGEAFRAGNYIRTIELLESVRERLTPAEHAKLRLAKKRASGG